MNKTPSSKTLFGILWAALLMEAFALISNIMQLSLINSAPFTHEAGLANDERQKLVGYVILFAVAPLFMIFFFRWVYRAVRQIREQEGDAIDHTPGISVGYFFIPIACFFMPYKVISQVVRASAEPRIWRSMGTPITVKIWWGCMIASYLYLQYVFSVKGDLKTLDDFRVFTTVSIIMGLIGLARALLTIKIVEAVDQGIIGRSATPPPSIPETAEVK